MKKKLAKLLLLAILLAILLLTGCTADEAAYIKTDAIDTATQAFTTIEYEHHKIHEGDMYHCWYYQKVSDTGDKSIITFKTPNTTTWVHVIITVSATSAAHVRILEAAVVTDDTGATLAVYNRDHNSTNKSTVIDTSVNPDVAGQATYFTEATMGNVAGGTEIAHIHLGTGDKKSVGGDSRGTQEWILKQNTMYAFLIESTTDDDNEQVVALDWYELANIE